MLSHTFHWTQAFRALAELLQGALVTLTVLENVTLAPRKMPGMAFFREGRSARPVPRPKFLLHPKRPGQRPS